MQSYITAALVYLCSLPGGGFIQHVQERPSPGAWIRHTAESLIIAGQRTQQDPYLLAALYWHESRFDEQAVSHRGAFGVAQINPWAWHAYAVASTTPRRQIIIGARVLAHYRRKCGSEKWRRIYAYRHGHCGRKPARTTLQVMQTYREIRR